MKKPSETRDDVEDSHVTSRDIPPSEDNVSLQSSLHHTLVYTHGGGRFGNQLLNYMNLLAFQIEHPDFDVYDGAFLPYADLYDADEMALLSLKNLSKPVERAVYAFCGGGIGGRIGKAISDRIRLKSIHLAADILPSAQSIIGGEIYLGFDLPGDQYEIFDLADKSNVEQLRERESSVVAGWWVRCWSLVRAHHDTVRVQLQPDDQYVVPAQKYVSTLREDFGVLVGTLIRQDDYREWRDGQYFFTSEQYKFWMELFGEQYPEQSIGYLIASDEEQSEELFAENKFRFGTGEAVGPNHYLENFAELSLCDVILTPPSTFSVTAAFFGDVTVVPLYDGVIESEWEFLEEPLFDSLDHTVMGDAVM